MTNLSDRIKNLAGLKDSEDVIVEVWQSTLLDWAREAKNLEVSLDVFDVPVLKVWYDEDV